jgi:hypothetical protein
MAKKKERKEKKLHFLTNDFFHQDIKATLLKLVIKHCVAGRMMTLVKSKLRNSSSIIAQTI